MQEISSDGFTSFHRSRSAPRTFRGLIRIIAALLTLTLSSNAAMAVTPTLDASTAKAKIVKRGIGSSTKITRTDGSTVAGKIESIGTDSFRLTPRKSAPVEIAFLDVSAVRGPGLSSGGKIGLGILAGVLISAGIAAIVINHEIKTGFPSRIPI